ncbi:MAG: transposase [Methylococcales bacterium]|nr:transposase [Methylococcales bacterium]
MNESEKLRWVSLFSNYDISAAAFCREFDLPYASFMTWKRLYHGKLAKPSKATPSEPEFVELVVEPPSSPRVTTSSSAPVAELSLGSGVVLRIFTLAKEQV